MKSKNAEDKTTEANRIIECLRKTKKERDNEMFFVRVSEMLSAMMTDINTDPRRINYDYYDYYDYLDYIDLYINKHSSSAVTVTQSKSRTNTQGYSGKYHLFDIEAGSGTGKLFDDMLGDKTKP